MVLWALAAIKKVLIISIEEIIRTLDISVFFYKFATDEHANFQFGLGKHMLYY